MNKTEEKQVPEITVTENSSKTKPTVRARKRKRQASESSSDVDDDLPENTLETEKNLRVSAMKNNLDDASVKKILKKVVTNDHVLAYVKLREEEISGTQEGLQPKLTRAKAKELMKASPRTPWPIELTPIKHIPVKTRPEVTALIAQELPEDEDDDEYEPTHDDSEDDQTLESCSDVDSQPRTPATPLSQKKNSSEPVTDGPFKLPRGEVSLSVRKKLNLEEEATIALRTRSKLSLSETPIEHIESSFIPPDDLPMPDVDDLWNEFLNECLNPESKSKNEDDDELDPEYNVAADPDANEEDEEALDKGIIRISKKELNDLVTELMTVMPEGVENQLLSPLPVQGDPCQQNNLVINTGCGNTLNKNEVQPHWEGKQEPLSDDESQPTNMRSKITFESSNIVPRVSVGKTEIEDVEECEAERNSERSTLDKPQGTEGTSTGSADASTTTGPRKITISVEEQDISVAEPPESSLKPPAPLQALMTATPVQVNIELENTIRVLPEQVSILQQQLRQHIQLAATNFLQLFVHPVHWSFAHKYKGYLDTFNKIAKSNPKSVVNVCNLTLAMELVESWESSVSQDTEENKKMVEFLHEESEKCRRRSSINGTYIGDFPELFKKVVANSTVFLYPYMLPPLPYRAVHCNRRANYMHSEDALIVLGLDQFWWYVENNPEIFKRPKYLHPRRRWGLHITINLVCKHMLPWLTPKSLLSRITTVRKSGDKSNPIVKYFTENTIEPVKHVIVPFNPKLTLYEHPEAEMPKLWLKYLSQSSKRFKMFKKHKSLAMAPPQGIEIQSGQLVEPVQKEALPIDFTKTISCNRINVIPKPPQPQLVDKVDVHITTTTSDNNDTSFLCASNIYTLINTSAGAKLMPLKLQTNTVQTNSISTLPICSPVVIESSSETEKVSKAAETTETAEIETTNALKIAEISTRKNCIIITPSVCMKQLERFKHCTCCVILKRICKLRQALITEFFKSNRGWEDVCECSNKTYPRITNKLKLLVNNFKALSNVLFNGILRKLENLKEGNKIKDGSTDLNFEDFAAAITYQTKLIARTNIIRNVYVKRKLQVAFSKFIIEKDNPIALAEKLRKMFDVDMADMYTEFMGFLTAEQADAMGQFKEYFIRTCMEDLVKKVEEHVQDASKRRDILSHLKQLFSLKSSQACDICSELLLTVEEYPKLARYVFSLFPHRRKQLNNDQTIDKHATRNSRTDTAHEEEALQRLAESESANNCEEAAVAMDYEADDSSSGEEPELAVDEEVDPLNDCGPDEPFTETREVRVDEDIEPSSERRPDELFTENINNGEDEEVDPSRENRNEEQFIVTTEDREGNELVTIIKNEVTESDELTVTETSVQGHDDTHMSTLVMSEDESIKTEPPEWTREEDKLILQVLKQYLTPQERSDKTILEIIKDKNLSNIIMSGLPNKSSEDVSERVLYLLQLLILSE